MRGRHPEECEFQIDVVWMCGLCMLRRGSRPTGWEPLVYNNNMSVVHGMKGVGGVCEMCMCLARDGVGVKGWIIGLALPFLWEQGEEEEEIRLL